MYLIRAYMVDFFVQKNTRTCTAIRYCRVSGVVLNYSMKKSLRLRPFLETLNNSAALEKRLTNFKFLGFVGFIIVL